MTVFLPLTGRRCVEAGAEPSGYRRVLCGEPNAIAPGGGVRLDVATVRYQVE